MDNWKAQMKVSILKIVDILILGMSKIQSAPTSLWENFPLPLFPKFLFPLIMKQAIDTNSQKSSVLAGSDRKEQM